MSTCLLRSFKSFLLNTPQRALQLSVLNRLHRSFHCSRPQSGFDICERQRRRRELLQLQQQQEKWMTTPALTMNKNSSNMSNSASSRDEDRLVWVDLEMTGLEVETDTILEIACIVTDGDLTTLEEGPNIVIHQSDEVLNAMGEWCTEHHGKSGLTEAVRQSKISLAQAEQIVLDYVQQHTPKGKCPLAGNSIGMDKRFIDRYMPSLSEHLHYRVVDVSTIKELCRRWYPEMDKKKPSKNLSHRALDDIVESIKELKFYRSQIFKSPSGK